MLEYDKWGIPKKSDRFLYPFCEHSVKKWENGKRFAVCITHDVDNPFKGYNIPWSSLKKIQSYGHISFGYKAKLLFNLCKYKLIHSRKPTDPNFCFDEWINYERSLGTKSCFYVGATASWDEFGTKEDVKYECTQPEIAEAIREVVHMGWEIGLHASICAGRKYNTFLQEKQKLERVIGGEVCGVRQHFWSPGEPKMMKMIEDAGFVYDTSLGLNDMLGFRYGKCTPYTPFGCKSLIEIPPTAMDAGVESKEDLRQHFDICAQFGGVVVLDWHLEQWNPNNLGGIGPLLLEVIDDVRSDYKDEILWCTPLELAEMYAI